MKLGTVSPGDWNNGMMERWNNGLLAKILIDKKINKVHLYWNSLINPTFHSSTIPTFRF